MFELMRMRLRLFLIVALAVVLGACSRGGVGGGGYSLTNQEANEIYEMTLKELAAGDDYDAMIRALEQGVVDLNMVTAAYRKGNMTQADFERHLKQVGGMYAPLVEALGKAQSEGKLTFNQQKAAVQLLGKYAQFAQSAFNLFAGDLFK